MKTLSFFFPTHSVLSPLVWNRCLRAWCRFIETHFNSTSDFISAASQSFIQCWYWIATVRTCIRWLMHCACVRACNWGCLVLESQRTKTPNLKPYGQNIMLLGKHYYMYYVWASARVQYKLSFLHTNCMHTTVDKGARQQHRSGNLILKTNKINTRTHARTCARTHAHETLDTWHTHTHTHTKSRKHSYADLRVT